MGTKVFLKVPGATALSSKVSLVLPSLGAAALSSVVPAALTSCSSEGEPQKPNVIIILADDLGYGDLECYGARNVLTPNVNELAQSGIRFTNMHATASTSTPSRYSLLTGMYAWRKPGTDIAAGNAGMIIRPEQYSMADMFKDSGYTTCAIGKWHLGLGEESGKQDWNKEIPVALDDIGFDYSYIMAATADRVPCVFLENGKVANWDKDAPIEVSYKQNFPGEPTGRDNPELLTNLKSSQGHDMSIVNGIGRIGFMKGGGKALWKDENIADSITVHAVNFIKDNKDKPFFMYFATNDVHVPRFPNERFRGATNMGLRGDAIAEFDWSVGKIVETLKEEGLLDNTLIILSSDNGPVVDDGYADMAKELLNGHDPCGGLRGGKYSALEGGTMVPMIVSWPSKVSAGAESDALMSQIDLFASLGKIIGAKIPETAAPDSRDHSETLVGENFYDIDWVLEQACDHTLSIRNKDWKYIEPSDGPEMIDWGPEIETGEKPVPQLFDISSNIERHNVAAEHPDVVWKFQDIMEETFKKEVFSK